jgi:uncharacterized BrkB/YihY/UPF0761 family membrane protein
MLVRVALLILAVSQLVIAVWMVADPASFFDHVGGFGTRNDHYIRDVATWSFALAIVAAVAAFRRSWQLPVLTFAALQFTFHAINHIVDADEAVASTSGVGDAVELAIGALLLAAVALLVHFGPERQQPIVWVSFGSGLIMVAWLAMSAGFGLYLREVASYGSVFSNLATIVVLIGYVYASSVIFLGGVQVDALVRERRARASTMLPD